MKVLLSLIFVLILSSCANKKEVTSASVKFTLGAAFSVGTVGDNGATLYGTSDNGDAFMMDIPAGGDLDLSLRNGTWSFVAMAWEGFSANVTPYSGKVRCARQGGIQFAGTDLNISLTLSNTNCSDPFYGSGYLFDHDADGGVGTAEIWRFSQIQFYPAMPDVSITGFDTCEKEGNSVGCVAGAEPYYSGVSTTYSIHIRNYIREEGVFSSVVNKHIKCSDVGGASSQGVGEMTMFDDGLNIPSKLPIELRVGYDVDCVTGPGQNIPTENLLLDDTGLVQLQNNYSEFFGFFGTVISTNDVLRIFHKNQDFIVCGPGRGDQSNFLVGGNFSPYKQPYAICNADQFNLVGDTHNDKNLALMSDIDFQNSDLSLISANDIFPDINFKPIGASAINKPSSTVDVIPFLAVAYDATFDGMGYTIRNGTFQSREDGSNIENVGLFRKLGSNGKIKNLELRNMRIEIENDGPETVALLVSDSVGTISDISVHDSEVRNSRYAISSNPTGVIVGNMGDGSITNAKVFRARVEGTQNVGGLVGLVTGPGGISIQKSFFAGSVEGTQEMGGLVGRFNSSGGGLIKSSASGVVNISPGGSMPVQSVGGLVGVASLIAINDSYSKMLVAGEGNGGAPPFLIGGIVGSGTSSTVSHTLNLGVVNFECQANNTSCEIGDISGANTGISIFYSTAVDSVNEATLGGLGGTNEISSLGDLYTAVSFNAYTPDPSWDAEWQDGGNPTWGYFAGFGPYLQEEINFLPCLDDNNYLSVADQITNGRGGDVINPVKVCTFPQILEMQARTDDRHYKMVSPIFAGVIPPAADTSFTGSFNGNGNELVAGEMYRFNEGGLFHTIGAGGVVEDISFIGFKLWDIGFDNSTAGSATSDTLGVVAGTNNGVIKDIDIKGSFVFGKQKVGAVVGVNNGLISKVEVGHDVDIVGHTSIGSITGINYNLIENSESYADISNVIHLPGPTDVFFYGQQLGGITGTNHGDIKEVSFGGQIDIRIEAGQTTNFIGGVVGKNFSPGTITDSSVGDYHEGEFGNSIFVELQGGTGSANHIGGIVGNNNSSSDYIFNNIFSMGEITIDSSSYGGSYSVPGSSGPLVGSSTATTPFNAKSFYRERVRNRAIAHTYNDGANDTCPNTELMLFDSDMLSGNYSHVVVSESGGGRDKFSYEMDNSQYYSAGYNYLSTASDLTSECSTMTNSDIVFLERIDQGNLIGTLKSEVELKEMNTYCDDALSYTTPLNLDPNTLVHDQMLTSCSSGWDMSQEFSGALIGSQRVIDYHYFFEGIIPQPLFAKPIWTIDEGSEFPRLFNDK